MIYKSRGVLGVESRGFNIAKPVEEHKMMFRIKTTGKVSTISIADEVEGAMLQMLVTDEMKELFHILLSGEDT